MFEELNERRKAVERNIAKGFGMDDADLDFEKALEDELEKGRAKKTFAVGDTFTRHGITYKCTGISANTGRPTWSKVKDGEDSKQEQPEKKEDKKEEQIPFDVDLEVADEMWTGKESKAYDKALESGDEKEQKRLLKIAIDRAKEKGVNIARKKDSDSMKGVTRHMSPGQEEEAFKQAMQSKKPAKEEKQQPKKLSELKRGDTVALIMERYNPQLGNYVTIKKVQIEGTTSKSFKVDYMKFDKETGERSDKSSSVYGSSKHYILLPEEVNSHIKDGKWKGDRISGGNPFEDETNEKQDSQLKSKDEYIKAASKALGTYNGGSFYDSGNTEFGRMKIYCTTYFGKKEYVVKFITKDGIDVSGKLVMRGNSGTAAKKAVLEYLSEEYVNGFKQK